MLRKLSSKNQQQLKQLCQKRGMMGLPEDGVRGEQLRQMQESLRQQSAKSAQLWKNVFIFSGVPLLLGVSWNTYKVESEHFHHLAEHPPHYKELPYLHIRRKPFPWGDGEKSLFFNPQLQKTAAQAASDSHH